jgi:hypothetical protein
MHRNEKNPSLPTAKKVPNVMTRCRDWRVDNEFLLGEIKRDVGMWSAESRVATLQLPAT